MSIASATKSWVPQNAWQAAQKRAQAYLGTKGVKLYKSRWSKRNSGKLISSSGQDAWLVHAKNKSGKKTVILVEKSSQNIYEAFPLAQNTQGKHMSTVNTKASGPEVLTWVQPTFPTHKMVHAIKVKGGANFDVGMQLGHMKAHKKAGNNKIVIVQGSPDGGRFSGSAGPSAAAQLRLSPSVPVFNDLGLLGPGYRTITPPHSENRYKNIRFLQSATNK